MSDDVSPAIVEELRESVASEESEARTARAEVERSAEEALNIMETMIDRWHAVRDQIEAENSQAGAPASTEAAPQVPVAQAPSPEEEAQRIIASLKGQQPAA